VLRPGGGAMAAVSRAAYPGEMRAVR